MSRILLSLVVPALLALALFAEACTDDTALSPPPISLGDASTGDAADPDGKTSPGDGGFETADGILRADRFVTKVVAFTPGDCAGFGASSMPDIVLGPPVGAGALKGSLDVVSLGVGGTIVLSFEPNAIVDGPGADFIVFENAFYAGGNASQPSADPGEVGVSEDGETWKTFPCAGTAPYGECAGWHPVYSAPGNGISPIDAAKAGGEAYDLSEVGLTTARYVRIVDKSRQACAGSPRPNTAGFDLDAIAIVHAASP